MKEMARPKLHKGTGEQARILRARTARARIGPLRSDRTVRWRLRTKRWQPGGRNSAQTHPGFPDRVTSATGLGHQRQCAKCRVELGTEPKPACRAGQGATWGERASPKTREARAA